MKGHLGFHCKVCLPPSPPQNLRQPASNATNAGWILWDAPADSGGGPVLAYRVEYREWGSGLEWTHLIDTQATTYNARFWLCRANADFRVTAINRCGLSHPAETIVVSPRVPTQSEQLVLVTSSASVMPPCWATSIKVWCVGRGGSSVVADYGGGGGGLAWKSWTNNTAMGWTSPLVCTIRNNYSGNDSPITSVAFEGSTVWAGHAEGTGGGATYGGNADGGANGAPGGESSNRYLNQYSYIPGAGQYAYVPGSAPEDLRYYYFGGGIGGGDPLPEGASSSLVESGFRLYPYPVSTCMRHPAHDRSGLLGAVAMYGLRATESCAEDAAFGSGASRWPIPNSTSPYGGPVWQYHTAGYGGGGFANSPAPGGAACILIGYNL